MAAEWVMPEQPRVSTSASSMMPFLTFSVSLHAPCCGAHQPTPCVKPEMSVISFACTQLPSSGMGAGPWLGPLATQIIFSTSCVYCIVRPPSFAQKTGDSPIQTWAITQPREILLRAHVRCAHNDSLYTILYYITICAWFNAKSRFLTEKCARIALASCVCAWRLNCFRRESGMDPFPGERIFHSLLRKQSAAMPNSPVAPAHPTTPHPIYANCG